MGARGSALMRLLPGGGGLARGRRGGLVRARRRIRARTASTSMWCIRHACRSVTARVSVRRSTGLASGVKPASMRMGIASACAPMRRWTISSAESSTRPTVTELACSFAAARRVRRIDAVARQTPAAATTPEGPDSHSQRESLSSASTTCISRSTRPTAMRVPPQRRKPGQRSSAPPKMGTTRPAIAKIMVVTKPSASACRAPSKMKRSAWRPDSSMPA